jgi:hypothetical protein
MSTTKLAPVVARSMGVVRFLKSEPGFHPLAKPADKENYLWCYWTWKMLCRSCSLGDSFAPMISQDLNGRIHYDRINAVSWLLHYVYPALCLLHYQLAAGSTQIHKPTDFDSNQLWHFHDLMILHWEWVHTMLDGGPICLLMDWYRFQMEPYVNLGPSRGLFLGYSSRKRGTNGDFTLFFVLLSMAELRWGNADNSTVDKHIVGIPTSGK